MIVSADFFEEKCSRCYQIKRKKECSEYDDDHAKGEQEREQGLPVSPMFDRSNSSLAKAQVHSSRAICFYVLL